MMTAMCENKATLILIDGPGVDDYTLSCAEHEEAMKSDTHVESVPFSGDAPCCHMPEGAHERIRARFIELLAAWVEAYRAARRRE